MKKTPAYARLESLDVLRGMDLFFLIILQPVIAPLVQCSKSQWIHDTYRYWFTHIDWEGFHPWDLIMPLFMFMAGASMPFAFAAYKRGEVATSLMIKRVLKRVLLLWLFGALVQGNLLDLDVQTLRLYSNTLQAIATGYFFSALMLMFCKQRTQIIIVLLLLTTYTLCMQTGGYSPETNLAETIDRSVLGRFRDGVFFNETGNWEFASYYHYTWIFSSLNFVVTVMLGVFSGEIVKRNNSESVKLKQLFGYGTIMLIAAFLLSFIEPVIKQLWTSSMTLYAGGWSFILLGLLYWWVDIKQHKKGLMWFRYFGMNSILAYMMFQLFDITYPVKYWVHGFAKFTGCLQPFIIELVKAFLFFMILRFCYKNKLFLKV